MRDRTGASQWEFPTEEDKDEDLKGTETKPQSHGETKAPSAPAGDVNESSTFPSAAPPDRKSVV